MSVPALLVTNCTGTGRTVSVCGQECHLEAIQMPLKSYGSNANAKNCRLIPYFINDRFVLVDCL